ncbi:MAG: Ppx/GppA phosphatase family protein [Bacteroidota bacterium]
MKKNNRNLAAVDVGTNSFHLIVAKIKSDGNFKIIDRQREVIRLGEGSDDIKIIKPEKMKRAVSVLKQFKEIADSHKAPLRAVATSAVRESSNRNEFIKKVFEETGIEIEVISGDEEARLIYLGALKSVHLFNKKTLVIDIGGGSTEFFIGKKGKTKFSASLKLGAVRFTQKFFMKDQLTDDAIKACRQWIRLELNDVARAAREIGFDIGVGTSGTIMSTGWMIEANRKGKPSPFKNLNNYEFTKEEFDIICREVLSRKTIEERKKIPGCDEKRADIIPAGIIILDEIFNAFELDRMTISAYALREGIIVDTNTEFLIRQLAD